MSQNKDKAALSDDIDFLDETIFDEALPHSPNMLTPPIQCRAKEVNYFVPNAQLHSQMGISTSSLTHYSQNQQTDSLKQTNTYRLSNHPSAEKTDEVTTAAQTAVGQKTVTILNRDRDRNHTFGKSSLVEKNVPQS